MSRRKKKVRVLEVLCAFDQVERLQPRTLSQPLDTRVAGRGRVGHRSQELLPNVLAGKVALTT